MHLCGFSFFSHSNKIYLACRVKVGLKKMFFNQFQTYLFLTFFILFFFKFYTQFTIKPM
jgi:hypothetical protein